MKKIAFITSVEDSLLTSDDQLCLLDFKNHNFLVLPVVWDRAQFSELKNFDALIFRSCWNYHRKYLEFLEFLKQVKATGVPVFNSVEVIKRNLNKKHILEIGESFLIPKTKYFEIDERLTCESIAQIFSAWQTQTVVVKPCVSLNGHDTYLFNVEEIEDIVYTLRKFLDKREMIIQEFIPEIKTAGEISLVFFNKVYSHSIRKLPSANEFKVHEAYGGSKEKIEPEQATIRYAQELLFSIQDDLLFARVDVVQTSSGPCLIEIELTDPMLYFEYDAGAAKRFAVALTQVLS